MDKILAALLFVILISICMIVWVIWVFFLGAAFGWVIEAVLSTWVTDVVAAVLPALKPFPLWQITGATAVMGTIWHTSTNVNLTRKK